MSGMLESFRYQYLMEMQRQNRKMYRELLRSGELDEFVDLKEQEAHQLYQQLLSERPQPPSLPDQREVEEYVRAMMFEFSDEEDEADEEAIDIEQMKAVLGLSDDD